MFTSVEEDPENSPLVPNPFIYGLPILDPEHFIGREQETQEVFSHLNNGRSVSIWGERRTGKTSFLKHLTHPETRNRFGFDAARATFVFVDGQSLGMDTTLAGFWRGVFQEIQAQFTSNRLNLGTVPALPNGPPDLKKISAFLDKVAQRSHRIVILLDELERIAEITALHDSLFHWLRSLVSHHGLLVVTASRCSLVELGISKVIDSSFHNVFSSMSLSFFAPKDPLELAERYLALSGSPVKFEDSEHEGAANLGGYHPFFTQMAYNFLFSAYQDTDLSSASERIEEMTQRLIEEMDSHLKFYWEKSSEDEQQALLVMANRCPKVRDHIGGNVNSAGKLATELQGGADRLVKRSLVLARDGKYALFSPIFADWIKTNVPTCRNRYLSQKWWPFLALVVMVLAALIWLYPGELAILGKTAHRIGEIWDDLSNLVFGIAVIALGAVLLFLVLTGRMHWFITLLKRIKIFF